jgi:hypothetical protein
MFVWGAPGPVYYDSLWVRVDHGGILFSKVGLGDKVNKGDLMGHVTDPITNAQYPVRATRSGRLIGMAVDQVVMAGFAAYHLGTKPDSPGFHTNRDLDNEGTRKRAEAAQSGDDLIDNDG